jgi:hypothetical protein
LLSATGEIHLHLSVNAVPNRFLDRKAIHILGPILVFKEGGEIKTAWNPEGDGDVAKVFA